GHPQILHLVARVLQGLAGGLSVARQVDAAVPPALGELSSAERQPLTDLADVTPSHLDQLLGVLQGALRAGLVRTLARRQHKQQNAERPAPEPRPGAKGG